MVSLVAAVISAGTAAATAYISRRIVLRDRRKAASELGERYRVSLLQAAYELQARLYNIIRFHFLTTFVTHGSEAEAEYATHHTVYLIGQYLCWVEIKRREALSIGNQRRQRNINAAMWKISEAMNSGSITDPVLRVFRGNQRAIGEIMTTTISTQSPAGRTGPRWDCIGYPAFVKVFEDDQETARWFATLVSDMDALAADPDKHLARLTELQHALVELVGLLDLADGYATIPRSSLEVPL